MKALQLAFALVGGVWLQSALASTALEVVVSGIPHQALFAIDFDGDTGYAVGAGGEVQRTTDGGRSWSREAPPGRHSMLGVAVRGERAVAVGQMGLIAVRDRQGSWVMAASGTEERLFDVDINARGVAIAVGAFGALLRSEDGGQTWSQAQPQWRGIFKDSGGRLGDFFEPSLYGVQLSDDGQAWVVGEVGLILYSKDAGLTWQVAHAGESRPEGVDPTLSSIQVRSDGKGYAVGQEGYMLTSRDGGLSWSTVERKTHSNLLSVSTDPRGTVVVTGMRDLLFSPNDGRSWKSVQGEDIAIGWYSGAGRSSEKDVSYIVGNAGRILRLHH